MTDRWFDARGHIVSEILASRSDPWETWGEDEVTAHLRQCRYCVAIYAEFTRARAQFGLDPLADMPPEDLLEIAKAIPSRGTTVRMPVRSRRRRLEPALAALAAGLVVAFLWRGPWQRPAPGPSRELQRSIVQSMRLSSNGGLLFDATAMPIKPETRGAGDPPDSGPDLRPLQQAYAEDPNSPNIAYWLIAGLLASNHGRDADPYLVESMARFPRDARFHNLAAIAAYRRSELPAVEAALSTALSIERRPEVLYNMAKTLTEQGRSAESKPLWTEIMQRFPTSPVDSLARILAAPNAHHRAS